MTSKTTGEAPVTTTPGPLSERLTEAALVRLDGYLLAGARLQYPGRPIRLQRVECDASRDVAASRLDSDAGEDGLGERLKVAGSI